MTVYDWTILGYRIALGTLVLCIAAKGPRPMLRTILTILAVYLFQEGVVTPLFWPTPEWALVMIPIDAFAAWVIALKPAGRVQALIACTFIPQMAFHLGRYLNGGNADMNLYFWGLSVLGFVQLALAGGWWFNVRFRRHDPDGHSHQATAPPHRESMGR